MPTDEYAKKITRQSRLFPTGSSSQPVSHMVKAPPTDMLAPIAALLMPKFRKGIQSLRIFAESGAKPA